MEVDLGDFKGLFVLGSVFGTSTVSLSTLEQSKWKVIYTAGILTVHTTETVYYLFKTTETPILFKVLKVLLECLPIYSLVKAIVDYKSYISVALNLNAIENKLEKMHVLIPGKTTLKAVFRGWFLFCTAMLGVGIRAHFKANTISLPVTRYVTTIHIAGTQFIECTSLMMFLAKSVMIQKSITNGFDELIKQEEQSTYQIPLNRRRRMKKHVKTAFDNKWALLNELQGCLESTGYVICNSFCMQTILYRIIFEVIAPVVSSFWDFKGPGIYMLLRMAIQFIGIVFIWESLKKEKKLAITKCTDLEKVGARDRRRVKCQLLAKIHRGRVPFSCGLFDVNYGLLAVIMENVFLVITALIGNSKNIV